MGVILVDEPLHQTPPIFHILIQK